MPDDHQGLKTCFNTFALLLGALLFLVSCGKPVASFRVSDLKLEAPASVYFENTSKKADTYRWTFGDGQTSERTEPLHQFASSGNYLVQLEAIRGKKSHVYSSWIQVSAPQRCLVRMETPFGFMTFWLYDGTPKHRDNFLRLIDEGFYDSLQFHRVIEGFMVQGGDPNSRGAGPEKSLGAGGPGYTLEAEIMDTVVHIRGALAAARLPDNINPDKRSSGSQFYIVQGTSQDEENLLRQEADRGFRYQKKQVQAYLEHGGSPQLDREYTVFGQLIEGFDVLNKIAAVPKDEQDRPVEPVWMRLQIVR